MSFKEFSKKSVIVKLVAILAILLVALIIFQAGSVFGRHEAMFSNSWNITYGKRISDPGSIFSPFQYGTGNRNPHGVVGEIVSVKFPNLMIRGRDNQEEIITLTDDTDIRTPNNTATTSALMVGSDIIVLGSPDQNGAIVAKFIRILPPPVFASSTPYPVTNK